MWLRQAWISMRTAWIPLDHYYLCMWVYTDWPKGISGETLAGRQCVFSHEVSPEKALGESPTDPEDRPNENTHNWLWGFWCPPSFEPLSLCHDKDKLHPPPLPQKHFGALGFWCRSSFYGTLGRRKMGEILWCVWVEAEVNWRSTTVVLRDPLTFSQGSSKHKKGLDCAFWEHFGSFLCFSKAQRPKYLKERRLREGGDMRKVDTAFVSL